MEYIKTYEYRKKITEPLIKKMLGDYELYIGEKFSGSINELCDWYYDENNPVGDLKEECENYKTISSICND